MVTGLPLFTHVDLDPLISFVVGGHDIRQTTFGQTVRELNERSNIFTLRQIEGCTEDLDAWTANVRPWHHP